MDELAKLYYSFWSQFCPAYQEEYVPTDAEFPYITYSVVRPAFSERTITGVNVYDCSESFARLREIGKAIESAVKHPGVELFLPDNGGSVTLYRPSGAFIQSRTLPDNEIRKGIKADYVIIEVLSHIL